LSFLVRGEEYAEKYPGFKLVDRTAELEELISILSRKKSSSVLMTGPSGVGLSSLCLGLQFLKSSDEVTIDVAAMRLFWLDTNGLFASGDSAQINLEFQRVLKTLKHTPNSILIIEDVRDFIEACRNTNTMHFINGLVSAIRDGHTKAVLEANDGDLDVVVKSHSDFIELFTMMDVREPTGDALKAIVAAAAVKLEEHHKFKVSPFAVMSAVNLATKYRAFSSRAQPEKSVTLLDRAMSSYRKIVHSNISKAHNAEMTKITDKIREGEGEILKLDDQIREKIDEAKKNPSVPKSAMSRLAGKGIETKEIIDLRAKRALLSEEVAKVQKKFDDLLERVNAEVSMGSDQVDLEFSKITSIPVAKLNENDVDKLKSLTTRLTSRVFGQDSAIERIANGIKIARVGGRNGDKPQAAFLIMGPSGVGKTETAKALAMALFDDEKALFRFDMSEYMEKHATAKLIGAPPGYEGFEAGGILTNGMRKNPRQILLFDEIEKADPNVFNVFLQILSDGRLTDNVGRTVSFSEAIIIMTSNIGQEHFLDESIDENEARERAMVELKATYRPEFLNRFAGGQNILCFHKLGLTSIGNIVNRELHDIMKAYPKLTMTINYDAVIKFCKDNYEPRSGARGLPGMIQATLEAKIVQLILDNKIDTGYTIEYDAKIKELYLKEVVHAAS
jgi:ATP-dependent Clp protease ATP-binding subunit ClpB